MGDKAGWGYFVLSQKCSNTHKTRENSLVNPSTRHPASTVTTVLPSSFIYLPTFWERTENVEQIPHIVSL